MNLKNSVLADVRILAAQPELFPLPLDA